MININNLSNEIFQVLQKTIEVDNPSISHNAKVRKRVIEERYPLVIFECRSNVQGSTSQDLHGLERTRKLSFEIDIFAIDDKKKRISGDQICEDLENLVTNVMQYKYRMQGGTDAKLHNINSSNATKFVLHFTCEWYMGKNVVY